MRIEGSNPAAVTGNLSVAAPAVKPALEADVADLKESHRIQSALREIPDVRAEAVARGKALVADPNYPSAEQVKSIARLLAKHLA